MRNSIRYNIISPSPLLGRPRKQRSGRAKVHFRAGGTGRKHVQNHYQPRRNRVALMEGRPFFAWKYIPRSFSAAAFFIYTPPRREHVNARPLTPLLLLLDLHGSTLQARNSPTSVCVTPLLQSCWLQRACFISRVSNFFVFRCWSGMR